MTQLKDPEELLAELNAAPGTGGAAKPAEKKKDLPAQEFITLDVVGRKGKRYTGRFLYTVPKIGAQLQIGALKSAYLPQGSAAAPDAGVIAEVLAYLTVTLTFNDANPKPSWWKPLDMYDFVPYQTLYGRCLDYEAKFHGEDTNGGSVEGGAGEADGAGDQGANAGPGAAHVGRRVQAPPQRSETLAGDGS